MPPEVVAVAESGIRGADDVRRLADAGYQAVLVGETLSCGPRTGRPRRGHWPGTGSVPAPARTMPAPGRGEPMLVKICGVTSEADALLAVGLGADAIGFVFAPSPRQVAPQAVRTTSSNAVPAGILTVGVFRNEARSRVVEIVNGIGLAAVQLHGDETARTPDGWPNVSRSRSRPFRPGTATSPIDEYGAMRSSWTPSPGSGEVFDWRLGRGGGGSGPAHRFGRAACRNVGDAIGHLQPFGVDVSSGVEANRVGRTPGRCGLS